MATNTIMRTIQETLWQLPRWSARRNQQCARPGTAMSRLMFLLARCCASVKCAHAGSRTRARLREAGGNRGVTHPARFHRVFQQALQPRRPAASLSGWKSSISTASVARSSIGQRSCGSCSPRDVDASAASVPPECAESGAEVSAAARAAASKNDAARVRRPTRSPLPPAAGTASPSPR